MEQLTATGSGEEIKGDGRVTANTNSNRGATETRELGDNEGHRGIGFAKKKKTISKARRARIKAPVDIEKQCGVELPRGGQCARRLSCKSHSMSAKRAVRGRSAPFDRLLIESQCGEQAN